MTQGSAPTREFLIVVHTSRAGALETVFSFAAACGRAGVAIRILEGGALSAGSDNAGSDNAGAANAPVAGSSRAVALDPEELRAAGVNVTVVPSDANAAKGCEAVIAMGGDGGFLRGAELAYETGVPIVGVNLGHVGFLAEAEADTVDDAVAALINRTYTVEPRMTIDVNILVNDEIISHGWALNEASIENRSRQGLLELVIEVDDRPVSGFACDGVLVSTPTGSTAYAFSAGGPVMWPELEAILVVPSNAHALFSKPMVTSPDAEIAVEIEDKGQNAIAFCDGRRVLDVPAGARIEITRGETPVNFVRLDTRPFADRLVRKFRLPVTGWRGRRT